MIIASFDDVILRKFEKNDIENKVKWINDAENNQFLHYDLPARIDKTSKWFEEKDNSKRIDCTIIYNEEPVGVIGLLSIDRVNLKAEYYITVGETVYKKRGIATKATKAIIEYGFEKLGLHKIYLTVDADNKAAIRLYEKTGFVQEGLFIDDLYNERKLCFIDRVRYAIVKK